MSRDLKPYFEDDCIALYNGDCVETMQELIEGG